MMRKNGSLDADRASKFDPIQKTNIPFADAIAGKAEQLLLLLALRKQEQCGRRRNAGKKRPE